MRVFSTGGGVQSTAALILAARGEIEYQVFVFANTGDDSENPDTLSYIEEIALPYAKAAGVEFVEVQKLRQGKYEKQTLYGEIHRRKRSVMIPVRMSNGAPGNRACTIDFKIRVVDKWIAENTEKGTDVWVGLGITTDEFHRARFAEPEQVRGFTKRIEYPLIDLRMSRQDCMNMIASEGLPVPPRSACYFCPFHRREEWIRMRNAKPDLFQKAVELERFINHRREAVLRKDKVWFHQALRPLEEAVGMQMTFDDLDNCESGYCMV
ncbi:MAG: phosphoadenosine phosphosulfate reductase [Candidatus Hydrogenedentes bacterium]|nr:phosphoadenosine phosphosulfate reductase [Candidatus Hydrogenedentota bacterium]